MPHYQEGRDEVNAMAGSVNTLADHRQQFIQWWKKSMAEAREGLEKLSRLLGETHMRHTDIEPRALRRHALEIKSKLSMIIKVKQDVASPRSSPVNH